MADLVLDLTHVADHDELQVRATKLNKSLKLHLMGRLVLMPNANGVEIGSIGTQKFYLDGSQDRALTCDYLFPGWLLPIKPSNEAPLELKYVECVMDIPASVVPPPKARLARPAKARPANVLKCKFRIPYLSVKPKMVGKQNVVLSRPAFICELEAGLSKVQRASVSKTKDAEEISHQTMDYAEADRSQSKCVRYIATALFAIILCRADISTAVQRFCTQISKWSIPADGV